MAQMMLHIVNECRLTMLSYGSLQTSYWWRWCNKLVRERRRKHLQNEI